MTTHAIHVGDSRAREIFESGALAGIVGGLAMVIIAMVYAALIGENPLVPIGAIAATARGSAIIDTSASSIALGTVIHLFVAAAWGVGFAWGIPRSVAPSPAIALGTFTGVAILVVMSWIVVPIVAPETRSQLLWGSSPSSLPVVVAFAMHIAYGMSLALVPWLERRVHNASSPHAPSKGSAASH
jgi:hypothetical protein